MAVIIKPEPIPSHTQGTPRMLSTLQGKELTFLEHPLHVPEFFSPTLCFQNGEFTGPLLRWQSSAPLRFPLSLTDSGRPTGRRQGNRKVKGRTWKNGSGKENLASPGCGEGLALRERQGWCRKNRQAGEMWLCTHSLWF